MPADTRDAIRDLYHSREVWERFFFRYLLLDPTNGTRTSQREIYDKFLIFCERHHLPVVSQKMLGKALGRVEGLISQYSTGNQRFWFGVKLREAPFEGPIEPADLEPWFTLDLKEATERRPVGRPRAQDQDPDEWAQRRPGPSAPKGVLWAKICRLYREQQVIARFKEACLVDDAGWELTRDAVFRAFDQFCAGINVPTCSAARLRSLLDVRERIALDGVRWWWGVRLKGDVPGTSPAQLP